MASYVEVAQVSGWVVVLRRAAGKEYGLEKLFKQRNEPVVMEWSNHRLGQAR